MPGTWESPFAADSLWYVEIDRANAVLVDAGIRDNIANFRWDEVILINTPAQPLRDCPTNDVGWNCGAGSRALETYASEFQVPIPNAFVVPDECPDTPNRVAAIVDTDEETIIQFQPFNRETASGNVTFLDGARYADDNFVTGDGRLGAHGGSGLSGMGGTIRTSNMLGLTAGDNLGHCLKLELDDEFYDAGSGPDGGGGYRWPAIKADTGFAANYVGVVERMHNGTLLTLPDAFNVAGLTTLPAKIIANTLLAYGGRIVDSTSWDAMAICCEYSPDSRFLTDFQTEYTFDAEADAGFLADMQTIFGALMMVDNDGPFSIGGAVEGGAGGDPIDPGADGWALGSNVLPMGDTPIDGSEIQMGRSHRWIRINPLAYVGTLLQYVYTPAREHRLHFHWEQATVDTFQALADAHAAGAGPDFFIAPRGYLAAGVPVIITEFQANWNQNVRGLISYDVWMTLVETT